MTQPQYLAWFVNREKQHRGFMKMLARETPKQIMLVEAPANMGKTWLIQVLRHECRSRDVPVGHFDFRDRRPWDYLTLVRQARDQLGPASFNPMTQIINELTGIEIRLTTGPGEGEVALDVATDGGTVADSTISVGDVAGRDIVKDNFFFVHADSETARRAVEVRITDAFFACLERLTGRGLAVFLFDSYEEVTEEADAWIQGQLLTRVRDGQLVNVLVVLAGRRVPALGSGWRHIVARTGLEPFAPEHVREYIVERRGLADLDVETIWRTSGGNPGLLGMMADIAAAEGQGDDEDWL